MERIRLVLATSNENKAKELRAACPEWEVDVVRGLELPEETGRTFYANARLKANAARRHAPEDAWVVGEDSGLEVEGLGGRPGIHSARYGGPGGSDASRVDLLLRDLAGVEGEGRRARYVSELVALAGDGRELRGRGTLEGSIGHEARGSEGFGYDPVFVPSGETRTVAELGNAWKAANSHRAGAVRSLARALGSGQRPL